MKSSHETLIIRTRGQHIEEKVDQVAAEIGFTLNVNGKQVVTLLCTPAELDAMAIGFLLSEGILLDRKSLLEVLVDEKNYSVSVKLPMAFGFDKASLSKDRRIRIGNVKPGESKDAVFDVFGKFNTTPGIYELEIVGREHEGDRFDKVTALQKSTVRLRVE